MQSSQIHDAQLDYYGRKAAACFSDGTIQILEASETDQKVLATLRAHEGPVWQASWSHPKFGNLVVSSGYDGRAVVSKEENNIWRVIGEFSEHNSSLNCVAFCPPENGCIFACGSSDGKVSIVEVQLEAGKISLQKRQTFHAHQVGVNALSWAPYTEGEQRFVTGGGDSLVKIWKLEGDIFNCERELTGHTDWVRDVCWSPSMLSMQCIASGSQDKSVILWTNEHGTWESKVLSTFPDCVFRTSFSLSGNMLAISSSDGISLWKEGVNGWERNEHE